MICYESTDPLVCLLATFKDNSLALLTIRSWKKKPSIIECSLIKDSCWSLDVSFISKFHDTFDRESCCAQYTAQLTVNSLTSDNKFSILIHKVYFYFFGIVRIVWLSMKSQKTFCTRQFSLVIIEGIEQKKEIKNRTTKCEPVKFHE